MCRQKWQEKFKAWKGAPSTVAGYEDRRSFTKECKQPLEAGRGREIDSPLEPPERTVALSEP